MRKKNFAFEIEITNSISSNTFEAVLEMFSFVTPCTSLLYCSKGEDQACEGQKTSEDGQNSLASSCNRTKILKEKTRLKNRCKMMRNIRFAPKRIHANSRDVAKC